MSTLAPEAWTLIGSTVTGGQVWIAPVDTPVALERKKPLERRTELRPGKPLEVRATPKRAPATRVSKTEPGQRRVTVKRQDTGPSIATRALVVARDKNSCVRCGGTLAGAFGHSIQHRIARGAGGRSGAIADYLNSPVNLIALCGSGTTGCHGWVEANPTLADRYGWSTPSWADPATWPVSDRRAGWMLLTPFGSRTHLSMPTLRAAEDYTGVRRLDERDGE